MGLFTVYTTTHDCVQLLPNEACDVWYVIYVCVCVCVCVQVTLLLHTFKPEQRRLSSEEYQLYAKCAPCEIYDSQLGDSKYFHHFEGKNFLYTAVVAFRK